ncbi:uncharacterized protein LOC126381397 [Pectinophora gossypiella]|uniref:uncharacterized protein LOC126381397 n=1 Tax=Pectinophora gossypiella TaxID=13191 RepID=UPI00214E42C8|nr:uncharacterized protein LOC126381397 [Pectinophora gossypiella]
MGYCSVCNVNVNGRQWTGHFRSSKHKNNCTAPLYDNVEIITSAFKGRIVSYRIIASNEEAKNLPSLFLNNIRKQIRSLVNHALQVHTSVKINFEFFLSFLLPKTDVQEVKSFATKNFTIHLNFDFDNLYNEVVSFLLNKVGEFEERDSGWTFLSNSHLEININKYQPLSGSSFISLPKYIRNKKACLNIQNKDDFCFLWCVTAALYPSKKHPERVSSYPHFQQVLNIKDLNFPITFSDISIFEKNNPSLSIFVYGLKNGKEITGPLYKSESTIKNDKRKVVHLLFLENDTSSHFCLIKDLTRLVRNQITKHHEKVYYCENCLLFFHSVERINSHLCEGTVTVLPEEGSFITFKNYNRKQDIPFVIYADFETILRPIQDNDGDTANTTKLQCHVPAAFAYNIVSSIDPNFNQFRIYRGRDCVNKFINMLLDDAKEINTLLNTNRGMKFTESDARDFEKSLYCHICNNFLWGKKVRDHCHITGKYRGAAHRHCNLQFKVPKCIPIFFHNLSGYDCHLFIKQLGEVPGKITIIPKTKEKYTSFSKFVPINEKEKVHSSWW